MFSFSFDPDRRILTITGEELWSLVDLAKFSVEALAYGATLRVRYGQFAVLNDVRQMPVQSSSVATGLETVMAKSASITTAPIATVVSGMLPKLQVERVLRGDNTRAFLTMEEATAWLDEQWTPGAGRDG